MERERQHRAGGGGDGPARIKDIRDICPGMPLLVPGVGPKEGPGGGGRASVDSNGRLALINSSRGIIYASSNDDFADAARDAAARLRDAINVVLEQDGQGWS